MATYTTNLSLKKPATTDLVSVADINGNMDALDTAVAGKQGQHSAISVTILTSDWSNGTATVTATGVTASNTVIVSPAPSSMDDWGAAGIKCTAQGANTLTFTCAEAPESAITANVVILP